MRNFYAQFCDRTTRLIAALQALSLNKQILLAFLAGAISVFAYAPFRLFPLILLSWGILYLQWQTASPRRAALLSFSWGFGHFWCGGGWLFVAFHTYGGMHSVLSVLFLSFFFAYLALYPTLAGWLFARLRPTQRSLSTPVLAAACWALVEWLRGWIFTGVPWLSLGYTQTPSSPLAGFAPLFGSYGCGFLLVLCIAYFAHALSTSQRRRLAIFIACATLSVGGLLRGVSWTQQHKQTISVSLIQPNIPQSLKWDPEHLGEWLRHNLALVEQHPAQLIALPETTLPLLEEQLPFDYRAALAAPAISRSGIVVSGGFTKSENSGLRNSAIAYGNNSRQVYSKNHLLPFGEFVPSSLSWLLDLVNIPMANQERGGAQQASFNVAGQRVAVNICYEDVFGEELIYALPQASLMLNMSNLAWYGNSHAQPQHAQIAQFRAMEAGRPMLRSTNTGVTAIIQPNGSISHELPAFTVGAIEADVHPYTGLTPYARWGNWPVIVSFSGILLWHSMRHKRYKPR